MWDRAIGSIVTLLLSLLAVPLATTAQPPPSKIYRIGGLDHRVGHFRPLRIMPKVIERLDLSTVGCFCVVQKQKGVADAMIEAGSATCRQCTTPPTCEMPSWTV